MNTVIVLLLIIIASSALMFKSLSGGLPTSMSNLDPVKMNNMKIEPSKPTPLYFFN